MRRMVWVAVGAVGGILAYRKAQEAMADARERGVVLSAQQVGISAASALGTARAMASGAAAAVDPRERAAAAPDRTRHRCRARPEPSQAGRVVVDSAEIRSRFLRYFADREHQVVPSASLLLDDPTLLFVNAGMVPFKPYFLGEAPPPYPRATSVQKVVRTLDIEEVGKTARHASFFQMAGNFSFGDYFKEGAIPLAWELLTKPVADGGYGFPEERLWATVYQDDDEALDIWHRTVGLPLDRIQRRSAKDNYWSMGVPGPGGPCSEIYYDRGADYGREGGPEADEDRYLEVWNLVFMQDELSAVRSKMDFDIRQPLPAKNIDTGMGLERMADDPAGRRQPLRDRHHARDPRPRVRAERRPLRRERA